MEENVQPGALATLTLGKELLYLLNGRLAFPITGLDVLEKRKITRTCLKLNPGLSSV
jgi:hypothetical protein